MKRQPIPFFAWVEPGSGSLLGMGLTSESAHADALARHGATRADQPGRVEGYAAKFALLDYPVEADAAGHNPLVALKAMVERGRREAPAPFGSRLGEAETPASASRSRREDDGEVKEAKTAPKPPKEPKAPKNGRAANTSEGRPE